VAALLGFLARFRLTLPDELNLVSLGISPMPGQSTAVSRYCEASGTNSTVGAPRELRGTKTGSLGSSRRMRHFSASSVGSVSTWPKTGKIPNTPLPSWHPTFRSSARTRGRSTSL
jgi:hypothetical protein